jgi:hypothetical protein
MMARGLNGAPPGRRSHNHLPDIGGFADIPIGRQSKLLGQQVRSRIQGAAVGQFRFRPWWGEFACHAFSFGEVESLIMPNSPLSVISPELVNY